MIRKNSLGTEKKIYWKDTNIPSSIEEKTTILKKRTPSTEELYEKKMKIFKSDFKEKDGTVKIDDIKAALDIEQIKKWAEIANVSTEAIPLIINCLGSDNFDVVQAATSALVKIGKPVVPYLLGALNNSNQKLYDPVIRVLIYMKETAAAKDYIPLFIRLLNTEASTSALFALIGIGDIAIPQLLDALKDANPKTCQDIMLIFGHMKLKAVSTLPYIITKLGDTGPETRRTAANALGLMFSGAKDSKDVRVAVKALIEKLDDSNTSVVCAALLALGKIGHAAEEARPFIIKAGMTAYENDNKDIQFAATAALKGVNRK